MDIANGKAELLDGTVLTIQAGIITHINDVPVWGVNDLITFPDLTEIKSYNSDVVILTTDDRIFGENNEDAEKYWSEKIGKKVVIMPYFYNPQNIYMDTYALIKQIKEDVDYIKKEKEGK